MNTFLLICINYVLIIMSYVLFKEIIAASYVKVQSSVRDLFSAYFCRATRVKLERKR